MNLQERLIQKMKIKNKGNKVRQYRLLLDDIKRKINYDSEQCRKIAGVHSEDIFKSLGIKNYDAVITRDNITDLL